MRASNLAHRLGGVLYGDDPEVTGFATDSREVTTGGAFLAIVGERSDGHDYAPVPGASLTIAERPVSGTHILVPSLVLALSRMAQGFREEFTGPVVAITGSAGKTTAKEFCAAALGTIGPVAKTPANRNTEFTAPLLWASLVDGAKAAVIEMGMRGAGQIAHLASFSHPTIGVVTNVGYAHIELLGSREGIAEAKGELFRSLPPEGVAIAWAEDEYLGTLIAAAGDRTLRTFGYGGNTDLGITNYKAVSWTRTELSGVLDGRVWSATIPVAGRHVALSAAAGLLAAVEAGADLDLAADALQRAELPPLRMEIRRLNGATFVVDTYNASPPAVVASLEALAAMPSDGKRLAVLGHMRELGDEAEEAHYEVGAALGRAGLDGAVLLGEMTGEIRRGAERNGMDSGRIVMAQSLEEVRAQLRLVSSGDTVLVKASRVLELEKALEGL